MSTVRLYRFFNFVQSVHGAPFGLCDRHRDGYQVANCFIEKIGESTDWACNFCLQEKNAGGTETKLARRAWSASQ